MWWRITTNAYLTVQQIEPSWKANPLVITKEWDNSFKVWRKKTNKGQFYCTICLIYCYLSSKLSKFCSITVNWCVPNPIERNSVKPHQGGSLTLICIGTVCDMTCSTAAVLKIWNICRWKGWNIGRVKSHDLKYCFLLNLTCNFKVTLQIWSINLPEIWVCAPEQSPIAKKSNFQLFQRDSHCGNLLKKGVSSCTKSNNFPGYGSFT